MASRKISELAALTSPALGDYAPVVDVSEAAAADQNKRVTLAVLGRFLAGRVFDFSIASGSKAVVTVAFGETLSPTPARAGVLCSYQTNADAAVVGVRVVPGSLSATQVQVQAVSDNHTGIVGTVVVR